MVSNKLVLRLENRLRWEIQAYLNHKVIPGLRSKQSRSKESFDNILSHYSNAFYRLGANYTAKIANRELLSSEADNRIQSDLVNYFTGIFWRKIEGLSAIQRVDPKLKPSRVISMEKDKISQDLSALVAWKSFNSGIKSKGIELQDQLKSVSRNGLVGQTRRIWSKDFTSINKQKLITDRIPNLERTSQSEEEAAMSFTFITQDDDLVCEICRGLELQTWALADPDIPTIPDDTHPNCRCFMMLAESEEDIEVDLSKQELLNLGLSAKEIAFLGGATALAALTGEELQQELEEIRRRRKKLAEAKAKKAKRKLR